MPTPESSSQTSASVPQGSPRVTTSRVVVVLGLLALLLVVSALVAIRFGEQPISLGTAFNVPGSSDAAILWSLRLPRVLLAMLVGAALAASGSTLQALL